MQPAPDPIYTLRGVGSPITYLKFPGSSTDLLYSGSQDGFVHIWDMRLNRIKSRINAHKGQSVLWISFLQDGRMVTYGRDGCVRVWSCSNSDWQLTGSIETRAVGFCPCALVCTPDVSLLAFPGEVTSTINLYDTKSYTRVGTLEQDMTKHGMVMCMKAAQNEPKIMSGYEDGSVALWDIYNMRMMDRQTFYTDPLMCLDFDVSAQKGVCASSNDEIFSYKLLSEDKIEKSLSAKTTNAGFNDLCIRNDKRIFAAAGWDSNIRIFGFKKIKALAVLSYHKESVQCLTFSDDHILACGSKDQQISLWRIY